MLLKYVSSIAPPHFLHARNATGIQQIQISVKYKGSKNVFRRPQMSG